jgi:hypothetical protein
VAGVIQQCDCADEGGHLVWICDCADEIHYNPDDPAFETPAAKQWREDHIAAHEAMHAAELAAHGGDIELHRHHLKYKALCRAVCRSGG